MKKSILVLVLSDLRSDARVRRQIQALQHTYAVTVVSFGGDPSPDYELIIIHPTKLTLFRKAIASVFLLFRFFSTAHRILHNYYYLPRQLAGRDFDLIIANDVETLPLAFYFPGNHKIIFDAHEYAPRHFEDKVMWRIFFQAFNTWLCRKYIPLIGGMMTVGKGLAKEYKKYFGVEPVVVTNANDYFDLQPSPVSADKVRLVHMGIATPSRQLELMINMMHFLDDRFTFDFYLLTPGFASKKTMTYIDDLKQIAEHLPNVRILPAIKSNEVVKTINQYDIGVFLLQPVNFNYKNTLPNKLFDFIQARLAIAVGPTPEMAEIVKRYDLGVVSQDFTPESLARELQQLTSEDILTFKINSGSAAKDLNAAKNAVLIQSLVSDVLR
jgi:hypothetical protein